MKKIFTLCIIFLVSIMCVYAYCFPRWKTMPIHVYVPQNAGKYSVLMDKAFKAWEQKSNGIIKFKYVGKQSDADIYVEFVDYVTSCKHESAVGCTHYITRNGFYKQSYIEIGTKETSLKVKTDKFLKQEHERSDEHLYGVMLHEIGHAIGLGHSDNKDSIMYPIDLNELQYITDYDLSILYEKYR